MKKKDYADLPFPAVHERIIATTNTIIEAITTPSNICRNADEYPAASPERKTFFKIFTIPIEIAIPSIRVVESVPDAIPYSAAVTEFIIAVLFGVTKMAIPRPNSA